MVIMEFACVILSYNHSEITTRCLHSVLNHTEKFKTIYLVHNGSQEKNVRDLQTLFPGVRHVLLSRNKGFSGGANAGLDLAFTNGARQVLFTTNDTELQKFELNLSSQLQNTVLCPRIEKRKTGVVDSFGGHVDLWSGRLDHLKNPMSDTVDRTFIMRSRRFYVPGTAFIVDKSTWQKVGGFDESLGTYWEDVDWSLRASQNNIALRSTKDIVLTHGIGKTCHSNPLYTVYYYHRNRRRVVWRHTNVAQKIQFSVFYSAEMTKKFMSYLLKKDLRRMKLLAKAVID